MYTLVLLAAAVLALAGAVYMATHHAGIGRPAALAVSAVLAVGAAYVGGRLLQRALSPSYQSFAVTPTLGEARRDSTLQATYRAVALSPSAPPVEAAFAFVPTRSRLGPLLRPRVERAEAVGVVARLGPEAAGPYELAFDDGAGVVLGADGQTGPVATRAGSPYGPNRAPCCVSHRTQAPDRFWLVDGGARVVRFERE